MGEPVSEESTSTTSVGPVLEVIILAAEDLKNVNMVGKMSVYVVAWVEPHLKRSTSVRHKTGRNAVWNDALYFPLTDTILRHPHSALTFQVFSTGAVSPSIVGSTYLALSDIAQMKATKTNPGEHDIVTLPLLRRSGRTQGSIEVSINLTGATIQQMMYPLEKGLGLKSIEMPGVPESAAVSASSDEDVNPAFLPSAPPLALAAPLLALAAPAPSLQPKTPPPARPPPPVPSPGPSPLFSMDPHPCAQARDQYVPVQIRRQQESRESFVLAVLSGVGVLVGGLVLGDIIGAAL